MDGVNFIDAVDVNSDEVVDFIAGARANGFKQAATREDIKKSFTQNSSDVMQPEPNNKPLAMLFRETLQAAKSIDDIKKFIGSKRIVILRKPKRHSLIADKYGNANNTGFEFITYCL